MKFVPSAAQERLVGDLLDQRVLEGEDLARRGARGVDEPRVLQRREFGAQPLRGQRRDRAEQRIAELTPDGAGQLRHELRRTELIEPRHQRALQGGGYGDVRHGPLRIRDAATAVVQYAQSRAPRASAPR